MDTNMELQRFMDYIGRQRHGAIAMADGIDPAMPDGSQKPSVLLYLADGDMEKSLCRYPVCTHLRYEVQSPF